VSFFSTVGGEIRHCISDVTERFKSGLKHTVPIKRSCQSRNLSYTCECLGERRCCPRQARGSVRGRVVKKDQKHSARQLNTHKNGTKTNQVR